MRRRLIRGVLGIAFVAVIAGCHVASHLVVQPDGSGTYSVTLTVADGTDHPGDALYRAVAAGAAKSDVPLPVEHYSDGNESGAKISYDFRSLADLKAESDRLAATGRGLGGIAISRGDTGWQFSAESAEGLVRDPGSKYSGAPGGVIDATQLAGLIHLAVVVELPGLPAANNATAVTRSETSSQFTWTLEVGREATALQASTSFVGDQANVPLATGLTPVRAVSNGSNGGSGLIIGLVVAVAVAVAAAGVFLFRRRQWVTPAPS